MEAAQGCTFDYVEVSISTLSDEPERYCGRQPRWFGNDGSIEAQGSVQIIFHSDSGEEFPGFRIKYEISAGPLLSILTQNWLNDTVNDSNTTYLEDY